MKDYSPKNRYDWRISISGCRFVIMSCCHRIWSLWSEWLLTFVANKPHFVRWYVICIVDKQLFYQLMIYFHSNGLLVWSWNCSQIDFDFDCDCDERQRHCAVRYAIFFAYFMPVFVVSASHDFGVLTSIDLHIKFLINLSYILK